jgi:hypothetical protein
MRDQIKALSDDQAKSFCTRLWLELTIAGRAIWSDENLDQATQLNALKWLNEMQHRVWHAHSSNESHALECLLDQLMAHSDKAGALKPHVRIALDRSLAAMSSTGWA